MEIVWFIAAIAGALIVGRIGLPPLVGYLIAGTVLGLLGEKPTELLDTLAHAGVVLLLFGVGLHFRLQTIAQPAVIIGALSQIILSTALFTAMAMLLGTAWQSAIYLGVILSFSSTVLAATDLETRKELAAYHGRIAIGILLIQDLVAVGVMLGVDHSDTGWAALLLIPGVTLLALAAAWLLQRINDDTPLLLLAVALPLATAAAFDVAGINAEFGALLLGAALSSSPKAKALQRLIWSLKEVLLVGFFLSVGMLAFPISADPALLALAVVILILILPFKTIMHFAFLVGLGLRVRTAFLAGAALVSYSEFTLLAGYVGLHAGLLTSAQFSMLALVTLLSFAANIPLNKLVHSQYARFEPWLIRFERDLEHPETPLKTLGRATHLVVGMGRTGTAAFDALHDNGAKVVGIDSDPLVVERQLAAGRRCVQGDGLDPQLWEDLRLDLIEAAVIAVPDLGTRIQSASGIRRQRPRALISSYALRQTDVARLTEAGVDEIHDLLIDAGQQLASVVTPHRNPPP